jgi:hypothetical protein
MGGGEPRLANRSELFLDFRGLHAVSESEYQYVTGKPHIFGVFYLILVFHFF